ncbi:MAG TPA: AAA family ATPase [Actinomycetota bacterium]|jgi:class 3 adenylate cyclase/tetratricopeptide (TPR) repeat protein
MHDERSDLRRSEEGMRTCSVCGERSPDRARFCWNCGSALAEAPAARSEERRLVTVLFCDLVGFTARSDGADPEDVKGTLRAFHPLVQREIDAHGGVVNQFVGDGVLALFGSPVAHEDDAERAVRAGLRIQSSIAELNEEDPGLSLAARIGIETGEVLVSAGVPGRLGGTVAGDVVNTVSVLQGIAPPGGVVLGPETFRAIESLFLHEAMPPVELSGRDEPLPVWSVTGARSLVPHEGRRRFRTSLLGRDDELRTLETAFRRTVDEGFAGFVLITGEAGVGKTRLLTELAGIADRMPSLVRWRQGRPPRFGEGGAFGAFADVIKAEAGVLDSDPSDVVVAKLRHAIAQLTGDEQLRETLARATGPLLGVARAREDDGGWSGDPGDEARREETFAQWTRFVELMAADDPLVLAFDDAHEAAAPFLEFVDRLATRITDLPLLLVVVGRPELLEQRTDWAAGGPIVLRARPLPERELTQLVRLLLDDVSLPVETIAEVVDRSEGIPLFAEEFAQMLRERASSPGGVRPGEEIEVPASLRSLVAARLDALPDVERIAIQDAAVVGRSFWPGALAAVGNRDRETVEELLTRLAGRELVRRARPSTVEGEDEYTFWHPLVRDVAYAQIPRNERAVRHRAMARWIEENAGDRAEDRAEQLAQHYGQAHALARAAGDPDAEALVEPAARYTMVAAERASGLEPELADRLFTQALSLLPDDGIERARALRGAGVAASSLARFDQGEAALRAAIEAFEACGDDVGKADSMVALSRAMLDRGELQQADRVLTDALDLLEQQPPSPTMARAYARHAGHLFITGRYEECAQRATRALELALEHGLAREEVLARNYLGAARAFSGDPAGLDALRDAVARGIELGVGAETAITMNNLANCMRYLVGPRHSLAAYEDLERFCRERGLVSTLSWAWSGQMEALFETGDWSRLETIARRSEGWEHEHGRTIVGTAATLLLAWVALRRGDTDTAAKIAADASERAARWGTTEYEAPARALRADIAFAQGRVDDAMRELDAFERAAELDRMFATALLPVVVRSMVSAGEVERAAARVDAAPPPLNERERLSIETARTVVEEAVGKHAEAADRYASLADEWRNHGFVLEEALAHLGEARCAAAMGERERAAAAAREARRQFVHLGVTSLADEAAAIARLT